eukprot:1748980-Rhodomonas_salina.7
MPIDFISSSHDTQYQTGNARHVAARMPTNHTHPTSDLKRLPQTRARSCQGRDRRWPCCPGPRLSRTPRRAP